MSTEARKAYQREYYLANRDQILANNKARHDANREEINRKALERYYSGSNSKARMLDRARQRARKLGREFSITTGDFEIPELCPVFGMKLERNLGGSHS